MQKLSREESIRKFIKYEALSGMATNVLARRRYDFLAAWALRHFARNRLVEANQARDPGLRGAAMRTLNSVSKDMAACYSALKTTQQFAAQNSRVPLLLEIAA